MQIQKMEDLDTSVIDFEDFTNSLLYQVAKTDIWAKRDEYPYITG